MAVGRKGRRSLFPAMVSRTSEWTRLFPSFSLPLCVAECEILREWAGTRALARGKVPGLVVALPDISRLAPFEIRGRRSPPIPPAPAAPGGFAVYFLASWRTRFLPKEPPAEPVLSATPLNFSNSLPDPSQLRVL